MTPTDVIRHKRDGLELTDSEIEGFLNGYAAGEVADYQMSALAMAIIFRGLTPRELARWTHVMLYGGEVLDFSDMPGRKIDKHSTGGVGDKISLPLAPLVAACGVKVPMISGRGLGHTGGTLDKLESIPGFDVRLSAERFRECVATIGCGLIGQTATICPIDRKLYSLRDVTATVESIPLISSSIMSKKLAEGIDGLILDVKFGSGAFMQKFEDAKVLAQTMVGIGHSFGKDTVALLTDMDQPLGLAVGNSLEVLESLDVLEGGGPADIVELTLAEGAEMLVLGHVAKDLADARTQLEAARRSGAGMRKFEEITRAQGGDAKALTDRRRMPHAKTLVPVESPADGFVTKIQTDEVGRAGMLLGAGRQKVDSVIDPAVGVMLHKKTGDRVVKGEPIATFHVNDPARLDEARRRLVEAYSFGAQQPGPRPLVRERLGGPAPRQ